MTRRWNSKAFIDQMGQRLWDDTTAFQDKIIRWANETMDDIASRQPLEHFKIQVKKLMPVSKGNLSLHLEKAGAPSVAASGSGNSLTDGSSYKVSVTFLIWDDESRNYIESEQGTESAAVAIASGEQIDISSIPTYSGDTSSEPATIWRRIYISELASGATAYAEPFYSQDIKDNTTTTATITADPTSTITPPSDSEVDQLSNDVLYFAAYNKYLVKQNQNQVKRFDPNSSNSGSPDAYDNNGPFNIFIYPQLSSSATTAQRTLVYSVYRRPHEIFYDVTRDIDLPIVFRRALIAGIDARAYEYRDRNGKESKWLNYEQEVMKVLKKFRRPIGRVNSVRDVEGDCYGFSI